MWHGIPFLTSQRIPLCDVTEDSPCLSLVVWSHTVYFSTKGFPYFWWRDVTHIFPYIASSVTRRWWLRIFSLGDSLSLMTSLRDFNRHESGFAPRIPLVLIMWDHKCNLMKWGDSPPFEAVFTRLPHRRHEGNDDYALTHLQWTRRRKLCYRSSFELQW